MDDLLLRASDWSLACDNALLSKLQEMSDNMVRRAETVNKECDCLMNDVDNLRSKIVNVTNDFLVLANTNFVENTVEEFQEFDVGLQSSTEPPLPTKAEKEAVLLDKMKEAIQIGLRSQQENEAKRLKKVEAMCNDSVESRNGLNLGYIIGSPKFFSSKYCGLKTDIPKAPHTTIPYRPPEASHPELEDSSHQSDIPLGESATSVPPSSFAYQATAARPLSAASDSLFTSPVQAPGIPSLSSTPNTDASYSPAPISKSNQHDQHSEAKYSPTPFSYIPVPARPPSTPSSSPGSSRADSPSPLDTDLTHRFTLPNDLSVPASPAEAAPAKLPEVKSESSMQQTTTVPTANIDDVGRLEPAEVNAQEVATGPISPPVKAQPVHKFMNASVLSQLQSRIAAGPKHPSRSNSSVSEVPHEEEKSNIQKEKQDGRLVTTIPEVNSTQPVQTEKHTPETSVATSKSVAPQTKVQVLPTAPAAAAKRPLNQALPSKQSSHSTSEPKLSAAPVKKSIFDSDSDSEDDFLFSSKPKKPLSTPKASIFSASAASPKKDIFGRSAILNASSDDSEADGDIFKAAASVSRTKDRSIFDDIFGNSAPAPTFLRSVPQEAGKPAEALVTVKVENTAPQEVALEPEIPLELPVPTPSSFTEAEKVKPSLTEIPEEEFRAPVEPNLAEAAPTSTVIVQQSQSVTTTTTSTDSADATRRSPDVAGISEITTITETTTVIEEIFTIPEAATIVKRDVTVEPTEISETVSNKSAHPASVSNISDSEDDDLFKDASTISKKPEEHPATAFVKITQQSADVTSSSPPPKATTVTKTTKARPVVKMSIFDSSDSDDDLFSIKKPKSQLISNAPRSSLFAPVEDVTIVPPIESKTKPISVQAAVPQATIPVTPSSSQPVVATSEQPGAKQEVNSSALAPISSPNAKPFQQVNKQKATTSSIAVKSKSLFDSTDSDSDDLFATKSKSKKATPKSKTSQASFQSTASVLSLPKAQAAVKPKKTSKLFDDSDDEDDDDLFISKSSKLSSAKSSLSALPIASTSTSNTSVPPEHTVIPSPTNFESVPQPAKPKIPPEEPKAPEYEPKANLKEKFASVSKNLESLFAVKPKLSGQPSEGIVKQSPPEEHPAEVPVLPIAARGTQSVPVSFEHQPDCRGLLKCATKNRPKLGKKRRPPTKGLQKHSAQPEIVPEEPPAEPESVPKSTTSQNQKAVAPAPDILESKAFQVSEMERSFEVQSPPLPPPMPPQTESSDEDDDEDSLFPRNRVYYD